MSIYRKFSVSASVVEDVDVLVCSIYKHVISIKPRDAYVVRRGPIPIKSSPTVDFFAQKIDGDIFTISSSVSDWRCVSVGIPKRAYDFGPTTEDIEFLITNLYRELVYPCYAESKFKNNTIIEIINIFNENIV